MKILFPIFIALALAGCVDTQTVPLDSKIRPATASIDVYKESGPAQSFNVIAELSWKGPPQDELRAQRYFMGEGRRLGGNGIITTVVRLDPRIQIDWTGGKTVVDWLFKAKVIVYNHIP